MPLFSLQVLALCEKDPTVDAMASVYARTLLECRGIARLPEQKNGTFAKGLSGHLDGCNGRLYISNA